MDAGVSLQGRGLLLAPMYGGAGIGAEDKANSLVGAALPAQAYSPGQADGPLLAMLAHMPWDGMQR